MVFEIAILISRVSVLNQSPISYIPPIACLPYEPKFVLFRDSPVLASMVDTIVSTSLKASIKAKAAVLKAQMKGST